MHELGHAPGLAAWNGVDIPVDQRTPPSASLSVMNYEALSLSDGYSNGTAPYPLDEWVFIRERRLFQDGVWRWEPAGQVCRERWNWPRCPKEGAELPP